MKFLVSICKKAWIIFPAFFICATSHGQQYALKNFSVAEGLPQSQVYGTWQDPNGYIWMGTKGGGIVKFDGKKFEPLFNDERLLFISKIVPKSNFVYIAHNNGFSIYDLNKRELFHPANQINNIKEPVSLILPITRDSILVGTTKHLFTGRYDNLKKIDFPIRDADDIVSSGILFKDAIYMGNNYGVVRLSRNNGKIETKLLGRKAGLETTAIRCFLEYKHELIVGTYGGSLYKLKGEKFIPFNLPGIKRAEIVQAFLLDSHNNLWVGTASNGVFIYNEHDKKTVHITETEGLCRNNIVSFLEDDWGNVWIGSSGGGVSRYNGQLFVHYTNRTGLPGKNVYSCLQAPDSTLWLGTSAPGITSIKNGQIQQYDAHNGFTDSKVKTIYYSGHHDVLFLGTEGDGLWTFKDNEFIKQENWNYHTGKWIRNITEDNDHRIFVSTASRGVICLDANLVFAYILDKSNYLPNNRINATLVDGKNIWIATEGSGLVVFNEGNNSTTNLSKGAGLPGSSIRTLLRDDRGRIWIGTPSGVGFYRSANDFTEVKLPQGFQNIYLGIDHQSSIYFGTAKGLVKINYKKGPFKTQVFGANEGFSGIECSQNAASIGYNSTVLFGTINGLTILQPAFERANNLAPRLSFEEINLLYENLLSNEKTLDGLEFGYTQNNIGFKFKGINQLNPEGVQYQWKLKGHENKWSPLQSKNEWNYTDLDPGHYVFMVKACNENLIWTEKPLTFKFSITNPWFRQTWFYISVVLIVVLLLVLLYFTLTYNNRRKQERERRRLKLENQLLEIQQMALRLQMNPHFIFNCLNSIQNLVSTNRNEDANFYIQKFSGLMRGMVDLTPRETIRLDQELKLLTNYLELEQLNRSNSFDYEIKIELQDEPDFYRIPPLLLQPFAENAIVHGFKGIDYQGKITVRLYDEGNALKAEISDNGIGFEKEIQLPDERNSAIKITTERLKLYNHGKGDWVQIDKNKSTGLAVTLTLIGE
ncbi:MAG TPA: two-component regulator propeller domain-containing protein [Flavobacteriales bacterium]|nr:two-component regulator propeller domain-containing protein [Flavobacteriales bacterium]